MRRWIRTALVVWGFFSLALVSGGGNETVAPAPISVSVDPATASLLAGGARDFTATVAVTTIGATSQMAFVSDRAGDREIHVVNANGSGQINLTDNSGFEFEYAWSPDGDPAPPT